MNTGLCRTAAIFTLVVIVGLTLTGCPTTKVVVFADTGLDAAIRASLGKPFGLLTESDLLSVTRIDARSLNIHNLYNIDLCRNLQWLDLTDNRVSDITPLATLTNLTYLNLDGNAISDITPLAGLFNLDQLYITNLSGNSYNNVWDLSPLITNADNGGLGPNDLLALDMATLSDPNTGEIGATISAQLDQLQQYGINIQLIVPIN